MLSSDSEMQSEENGRSADGRLAGQRTLHSVLAIKQKRENSSDVGDSEEESTGTGRTAKECVKRIPHWTRRFWSCLVGAFFAFYRKNFSQPIAMCKILLYGESTEIHIAGESNMKKLAWLPVEDYATTQMELVVMSAMKGYLRRMPEKEALKKVESILDPKVIRLAGDDGAPMPVQSNVDGAKLAAFIDSAVADSIRELEKREDDLSKAGVTMLGNVDGKSMVEQMSPQFLEFVLDAYRSLKYMR